jgi:hypothetical protein
MSKSKSIFLDDINSLPSLVNIISELESIQILESLDLYTLPNGWSITLLESKEDEK